MSRHSRANVRHEIAQQERRDAKRRTARPKPPRLCRGCLKRGERRLAVWCLLGTVPNCCDPCWQEIEKRPFVRAAVVAEANGEMWRRASGVELSRPPCLHCQRRLMSDEDWSDQVALFGRFTGLC